MKHAGPQALATLADLLAAIRSRGLVERRPGVFYRRGKACLHFHEDPAGVFADARFTGDWERFCVSDRHEQTRLLAFVDGQISRNSVELTHPPFLTGSVPLASISGMRKATTPKAEPARTHQPDRSAKTAIGRVRKRCLALPQATERPSHGTPCFFVRDKSMFVMFWDNHHNDGRLAIWCAAPDGMQPALISSDPERFSGRRTWVIGAGSAFGSISIPTGSTSLLSSPRPIASSRRGA